jgi:hypothetical protein
MQLEFNALQTNWTWSLVPRPLGANIIFNKWVFKNKLQPDSSLKCCKARWVVRGFKQWLVIDIDQTFSPVIKPATIHTILHLATACNWPIH